QVSAMVSRLLNITPSGADAADALAVAISASNETTLTANDDQASVTDRLDHAISAALARQGGQS
ncbi:MAG: crossover junction endodeoxyribonuclease RuvC, partial [Candidatus Puniceispirillales bacterium]